MGLSKSSGEKRVERTEGKRKGIRKEIYKKENSRSLSIRLQLVWGTELINAEPISRTVFHTTQVMCIRVCLRIQDLGGYTAPRRLHTPECLLLPDFLTKFDMEKHWNRVGMKCVHCATIELRRRRHHGRVSLRQPQMHSILKHELWKIQLRVEWLPQTYILDCLSNISLVYCPEWSRPPTLFFDPNIHF